MSCCILHPLYCPDQSSCGFVFFYCCYRPACDNDFRSFTAPFLIFNLCATSTQPNSVSDLHVTFMLKLCVCNVTSELLSSIHMVIESMQFTICNCTLHCGNYPSHPGLYSQTCHLGLDPSPPAGSCPEGDHCPTVRQYVWRWGGPDYKRLSACQSLNWGSTYGHSELDGTCTTHGSPTPTETYLDTKLKDILMIEGQEFKIKIWLFVTRQNEVQKADGAKMMIVWCV